ncbi:MAG: DUF6093 family protein [Dehalococcoidia bacterium]
MVLSTGDLERMRNSAESLMPDTCTIQTAAFSASNYGAEVETWTNTYTGVACRVARLGEQVRVMGREHGDQPQEVADWMVTLHHDQAVALGNRIVTTTRTLEIVDINADKSFKAATRVLCREIVSG